jgi:hypothetical protein
MLKAARQICSSHIGKLAGVLLLGAGLIFLTGCAGGSPGTGTAASGYSVNLSWDASTSPNIAGYNIYRASYSGSCGSFGKINSSLNTTTLYTDLAVSDGTSYCYATTAVNTSSEESAYSNIVSNVQIPAP